MGSHVERFLRGVGILFHLGNTRARSAHRGYQNFSTKLTHYVGQPTFLLDSQPFGSANRSVSRNIAKSNRLSMILNCPTSRSKSQYRRYPFTDARIITGSNCRRCPAFWLTVALLVIAPLSASAAEDLKPDQASVEFFEKEVRPLLVKQCVSCHGPTQQFSSLRVDSREALLKGGSRGPLSFQATLA